MKYIALIEIHLGMYWMPEFCKISFGLPLGLELRCAAYSFLNNRKTLLRGTLPYMICLFLNCFLNFIGAAQYFQRKVSQKY
jgi:hypothetical protein